MSHGCYCAATTMPPCSWCTRDRCANFEAGCVGDGEVSADTKHWPKPLCEGCLEPCAEIVPKGVYCYAIDPNIPASANGVPIIPCHFWDRDPAQPKHERGMCSLMGLKDWEAKGLTLLWDQVKECGLNMGDENDHA